MKIYLEEYKYKIKRKEKRDLIKNKMQGAIIHNPNFISRDDLITINDRKNYIDKIFESNNYGKFKVVGISAIYNGRKYYICEFIDTGYKTIAEGRRIKQGKIKDYYLPTVFNVGYIGDYCGDATKNKYYKLWHSILSRCYYSTKYRKNNTYSDCFVCERWLCFNNFVNDIEKIIGYREYNIFKEIKFSLDKDIFNLNNSKEYSLDNCCFVPQKLNQFFANVNKANTSGYEGVSYIKNENTWEVHICYNGKNLYLGRSKSIKEAYDLYYQNKLTILDKYLSEYFWLDKRIVDACYRKLNHQYLLHKKGEFSNENVS